LPVLLLELNCPRDRPPLPLVPQGYPMDLLLVLPLRQDYPTGLLQSAQPHS
jgi:hypothetical protein